ncbi:hypothetical protein GCM10023238_23190 [Streptomyces heliomycini]
MDAAEAYAAGDILPSLPDAPALPFEPGTPPSLDAEAEPAAGIDPSALEFLAARTAVQAHRMLARALRDGHERQPAEPEPTVARDAVRLAAGEPGGAVAGRLAEGSGRGREGLAVAVRAWRHGGTAALAVLDEEWIVEGERLARARCRPRLGVGRGRTAGASGPGQPVDGGRRTRPAAPGREGRWWPYREERGRWIPAGDSSPDPATALATAERAPGSQPRRNRHRTKATTGPSSPTARNTVAGHRQEFPQGSGDGLGRGPLRGVTVSRAVSSGQFHVVQGRQERLQAARQLARELGRQLRGETGGEAARETAGQLGGDARRRSG